VKPVNRLELIKRMRRLDFIGPKPGKRHQYMQRGLLRVQLPNPHQGDIGVGLLKRILREAEITEAEWDSVK